MPEQDYISDMPSIFGFHGDVNQEIARSMQDAGVRGYILWSEAMDPASGADGLGQDYTQYAGAFGHTAIVRIECAGESSGVTNPQSLCAEYAQRCADWVRDSKGCRIWIVGNEPNVRREHALNGYMPPELYAQCFNAAYQEIKKVQPESVVTLASVHPTDTSMGDPRDYYQLVLDHVNEVDAFALRAFTQGPDPGYITSSQKFQLPPLDWQFHHFRMFEPFLEVIPERWRHLPVYLVGVNHTFKAAPRDLGWMDRNEGWVWEMYRYVDERNRRGGQQVHCALLYCYTESGDWTIRGQRHVLRDFFQAAAMGYRPYTRRRSAGSSGTIADLPAGAGSADERGSGAAQTNTLPGAATASGGGDATGQVLLVNGNFEARWSADKGHRCLVIPEGGVPEECDVDNIFTPPGWLSWFHHDPGQWDQPEVRDAWGTLDPRRVHSGAKSVVLFTFFRGHDAGLLQQVQVAPGTRLRFSAWAHGWSNHALPGHESCQDDPYCSCGVGREVFAALEGTVPEPKGVDAWADAVSNFVFRVGIDPTGGMNPLADTVVWGQGVHNYNSHAQVPAVEVKAAAGTVAVFLRSTTHWAFKHNDAYWDDAEMVAISEPVQPADVSLGHQPDQLRVGDLVTIEARAMQGLTNVSFLLERPSAGPVSLSDISVGSDGEWVVWSATYVLQEAGTYEVVFTADGGTHVEHTFNCQAAGVTPRGAPRAQYERTYVLLPPGAGEEWALAVVDGAWDRYRYTIGGSADDAGIGDLDFRHVIAVNPDQWNGDLEAFFASSYPEVEYDVIIARSPDELREQLGERA